MERIALTFDDGPAEWTEPILDVLAENDALATFFVIGSVAENQGDLLQRIARQGHEIGNHTWTHPWLARDCDDDRIREELSRTNALLTGILGSPPSRFRAPHYDVDAGVLAVAQGLELAHTHGDITPPDWDDRCTAGFIATYVLRQVRGGSVVGLHDGVPPTTRSGRSRQPTVDAVATIVPRMKERGLDCVTVSTLLNASKA